jgi:hypothetical protein
MYASSPGASRVPQRSQDPRISRAMQRKLADELDPDGLRERAARVTFQHLGTFDTCEELSARPSSRPYS